MAGLTRAPAAVAPAALPPDPLLWLLVGIEGFEWIDPERWALFEGVPECCPDTVWDPSRVSVENGVLTLASHPDEQGRWLSGGVGGWSWAAAEQQYGRWDARVRMDPGAGVSGTVLLYPEVGWPPEINYYEIFETWGERASMAVTTHYGTADDHRLHQRVVEGDFTQWHVASVRWTPQRVTYLLDGRVVHVEEDPEAVPSGASMWPGFQTHVHDDAQGAAPVLPAGTTSVRMQVDWVHVYRRGPR